MEGVNIARLCAAAQGRFLTEDGVAVVRQDYVFPDPVLPEGYSGGTVNIGGVRGVLVTREGVHSDVAVLHIHGGGWTDGDPTERIPIVRFFHDELNADSYSVAYRLAPWHPYPAGLEDCLAFYQGLLAQGYRRILVGGESAGAHLALCLVLALKARGGVLPDGLWCSSPPVDMWFEERNLPVRDELSALAPAIRRLYAPDGRRDDPLLNPLLGDFHGFPPMLIQCGGGECLSEGAVALAVKACAANVDVRLHFGSRLPHCFPDPCGEYPEALEGAAEVVRFFRNVLALDGQ